MNALETAYAGRIAAAARDALRNYRPGDYTPDYDGRHDHVTDEITSLLLNDEAWADVSAVEISNIAYEAATTAIEAEREAAWAADRQMVSDMERDGLL